MLFVLVIIRLFFKLAQAWPEGIQAAAGRIGPEELHLSHLPWEGSSRIHTGQRAENRVTALDSDIILVPDRVSEGRQLGEGWQRGLLFKASKKE